MSKITRPVLCSLLVVLVATWAICPCTMAKALGIKKADPRATTSTSIVLGTQVTPPCCCKRMAPTCDTEGNDTGETPADDECPCCKRGGWMRDLPPQADAPALDLPALAVFDLPLYVTGITLEAPALSTAGPATGPPTHQRPHASPVGIVRLLS